MKARFKAFTAFMVAMVCALSFTACGSIYSPGGIDGPHGVPMPTGESKLLGEPKTAEGVNYTELIQDDYKAFKASVESFASDFAAYSYADYGKQDNFAVSPISVYMALALAAECGAGSTRQEILSALGVTYEQLKTHYSTLFRSLEKEYKSDGQITGLLDLSNSIWVNEGTSVKQACINSLSDDFYAYSYSADFKNNNVEANNAIRNFVYKQTKGLINKNFNLSADTLFTLINTLYLKTIWNDRGRDLSFSYRNYDFTSSDGSVKSTKLLQGYYHGGRAAEFDTFTTFFTRTYNGYKIKFILPKDGYAIDQVFSAENIAEVNSITNYGSYDAEENVCYETCVLFPEYKCKYDEDIVGIMHDKFGVNALFDTNLCNFSTLSDTPCCCKKIQHVTDLTVNKKGIEGAAVTVIEMDATAAPFEPIETVYEQFVVDKAFGFIITDSDNTTLFSGVVNNI